MYSFSVLREKGVAHNKCHEPAGSPEGGQFCSLDDVPHHDEVSLLKVGEDQYQIFDVRMGRPIRVQGVRGSRTTFSRTEAVARMKKWLKLRKHEFYKGGHDPHEFEDMLGQMFGAMRESQADILKRFAIDPKTLDFATPHSGVKAVGYSPTKKKWYGWSHRAVYGWGVGDRVPKSGEYVRYPHTAGTRITTDAMAKQTAQAFADSVA